MSGIIEKIDLTLLGKSVEIEVEEYYAVIRKAIFASTLIDSIKLSIRNEKILKMGDSNLGVDDFIILHEDLLTIDMDHTMSIEEVLKEMLIYDSEVKIEVSEAGGKNCTYKYAISLEFVMNV